MLPSCLFAEFMWKKHVPVIPVGNVSWHLNKKQHNLDLPQSPPGFFPPILGSGIPRCSTFIYHHGFPGSKSEHQLMAGQDTWIQRGEWITAVDGWNPANQLIDRYVFFPIIYRVSAPSQVVQDFSHQQYVIYGSIGCWCHKSTSVKKTIKKPRGSSMFLL